MLLLIIILILLILIYIVRISNNNDIIRKNIKTEEDKKIIKEEKKKLHFTKVSKILTLASLLCLIVFIISDFTSIDYYIMDYLTTEFITEQEFNRILYLIPGYIVIANLIYVQVNIGDFLLNYFKTQEEELEININKEKIMSLLYKKKPSTTEEEPPKTEN